MARPPVAIVHDYLTQRGGAERVVLSMLKAFPDAPFYTSLYDPEETFDEFRQIDVRTLPINHVRLLRRHYRAALPVLAPAFSRLQVDADVVLCSSSGWAHGTRVSGRKIVYCYTPARWLYQSGRYLRERGSLERGALAALKGPLLRWDRRAAATADVYLTSSTAVRERIRNAYDIDAEILPPPVTIDSEGPAEAVPGFDPGFALCVSRLLPYKNVDAIVAAFAELQGERLVVVGRGPEEQSLQRSATPNVAFVDGVSDSEMRWLYAHASYLVAASHEDYGLTPLEAAAFGKPSAVLRFGGFLDTVVSGETGVFFEQPTAADVIDAVRRVQSKNWDSAVLKAHASTYAENGFIERLRQLTRPGEVAR